MPYGTHGGGPTIDPVKRGLKWRILDFWRETGAWWAGEGDYNIFRVELENGAVCELEWDAETNHWLVKKVFD